MSVLTGATAICERLKNVVRGEEIGSKIFNRFIMKRQVFSEVCAARGNSTGLLIMMTRVFLFAFLTYLFSSDNWYVKYVHLHGTYAPKVKNFYRLLCC